MAGRPPEDRMQMLEISGVGEVKFERFGEPFLNLIRNYG
jgi:superfamily II DNA helicase RecQ